MPLIHAVATNIMTGFLGVGKTTAIRHLLASKPASERWAVLVNEFGEVGIDGALFHSQANEQGGIFIREVPGGCMCCAAGLPMQVALNTLLQQARPDRLLIEPTGLGHPVEVMQTLGAPHYAGVLDLRATITLVDARKVSDSRYTSHPTFVQQLQIADVIVANKSDTYAVDDLDRLQHFMAQTIGTEAPVHAVKQGRLDIAWLAEPARSAAALAQENAKTHAHERGTQTLSPPTSAADSEQGFVRVDNAGDGFVSRGWVFEPHYVFSASKLRAGLSTLALQRLKAVIVTDEGVLSLNMVDEELSISHRDDCLDSRLECITDQPEELDRVDTILWSCVLEGPLDGRLSTDKPQ
nr:GTP-binding protein [Oceanococcus sp. HetDA_MAG_MS8]